MQWKRGEKKNLTETLARSLLWKVRVAWIEKMSGKVEEGEELSNIVPSKENNDCDDCVGPVTVLFTKISIISVTQFVPQL